MKLEISKEWMRAMVEKERDCRSVLAGIPPWVLRSDCDGPESGNICVDCGGHGWVEDFETMALAGYCKTCGGTGRVRAIASRSHTVPDQRPGQQ